MIRTDELRKQFRPVDFREKRTGVYKVLVPAFHEDGDMYDLFLLEHPEREGVLRLCDFGLTLMKLSYTFDIDSPKKQEILEGIVAKNRCKIDDGKIYLDITDAQFECGVYQMLQVISKVSSMEILTQESASSHFIEHFDTFVTTHFQQYSLKRNTSPLQDSDLVVDYEIAAKLPIFIFAVTNDTKAYKAVIACLTFANKRLSFQSIIVPENLDRLSSYNRRRAINVADKIFTDYEAFAEAGADYLDRTMTMLTAAQG